jgi:hypothetical protein
LSEEAPATVGQREIALPQRSTEMIRGFSRPLNRGSTIGAVVAVGLAIAITLVGRSVITPPVAIVVAIISATVATVVAVLAVPAGARRAFEAYSWLGRTEIDRFKARTGSQFPSGVDRLELWLEDTPPTPPTLYGRVEVLAFLGRPEQAATELELIEPQTAEERLEVATLGQYIDWVADGTHDTSEVATLTRGFPAGSMSRMVGDVTVALADARAAHAAGDVDWSRPLREVRPELGRSASMVALRDTWRRWWLAYFVYALLVSLVAQVLLALR